MTSIDTPWNEGPFGPGELLLIDKNRGGSLGLSRITHDEMHNTHMPKANQE